MIRQILPCSAINTGRIPEISDDAGHGVLRQSGCRTGEFRQAGEPGWCGHHGPGTATGPVAGQGIFTKHFHPV